MLNQWGSSGGVASLLNTAGFILPFNDSGAGAVNTALYRGTGSPTFTRATTAAARLGTTAAGVGYLWNLAVASGTARSHYLSNGTYGGYLAEGAATNICLHNRDFTNAAWVKTDVSASFTTSTLDNTSKAIQIQIDVANGTILQSITIAAASRTFSAYVRAAIGNTGNLQITQDNGGTWTTVLSGDTQQELTLVSLTASVLNPVIGFRGTGEGDFWVIDCSQLETGAFATTPIVTGAASATRNADVLTYTFAGNADATVGSAYAEVRLTAAPSAVAPIIAFATGTTQNPLRSAASVTSIAINDGTATVSATVSDISASISKIASSWGGSTMGITGQGLATASGAFDGSLASSAIAIGTSTNGSITTFFGTIRNARIWTTQFSATQLQAITA